MEENRLERIVDFILEIKKNQEGMNETLAKNTVVLVEHERRSLASEARLTVIEDKLQPLLVESKAKEQSLMWVVAILGGLGSIFGILEVIQTLSSH